MHQKKKKYPPFFIIKKEGGGNNCSDVTVLAWANAYISQKEEKVANDVFSFRFFFPPRNAYDHSGIVGNRVGAFFVSVFLFCFFFWILFRIF